MQSTYFKSRGNSLNSLAFKFKHESSSTAETERERERREKTEKVINSLSFTAISFFH